MGYISVRFCDWCAIEAPDGVRVRALVLTRPTWGSTVASDKWAWKLEVCDDCRRALEAMNFAEFVARRNLFAGVTTMEREAP